MREVDGKASGAGNDVRINFCVHNYTALENILVYLYSVHC